MRLFEHRDFEQAIIRAADHFRTQGLREALIEKDYYVTEALRIIEQAVGPRVIFKGGTSLSKGWGLIQRFSEDIEPETRSRPVSRTSVACYDTPTHRRSACRS
jgi:predicted nucleotidyltransferase component of viral defense system